MYEFIKLFIYPHLLFRNPGVVSRLVKGLEDASAVLLQDTYIYIYIYIYILFYVCMYTYMY